MGGGSSARSRPSSSPEGGEPAHIAVSKLWMATWKTVDKSSDPMRSHVIQKPGWKTVRFYVSSTFEDFGLEREILATKVFPEMRRWCKERNIYFIDCDLKHGMSRETRTPEYLQLCLQEIERCKGEDDAPFFLHLCCEKVGWLPKEDELSPAIRDRYGWVDGLTHTEMEVLHGVFRKGSPNAILAIRDAGFISSIPEAARSAFKDTGEMDRNKLMGLRKALRSRFKKDKIINYKVQYNGQDLETDMVLYGDLDEALAKPVLERLKGRIETQYPEVAADNSEETDDPIHQEAMSSASNIVQDQVNTTLKQHTEDPQIQSPILLVGGRGTGKSAILASFAQHVSESSQKTLFYHSISSAPTSNCTPALLHRLLRFLNKEADISCTLEDLCRQTHEALSALDSHERILVIDGIDELSDDPTVTWLPRTLPPGLCCVLSLDPTSGHYQAIHQQVGDAPPTAPTVVQVPAITDTVTQSIIERELALYRVSLDKAHLDELTGHVGASSPEWLCVACHEVATMDRVTEGRIAKLPEDLNSLCVGVLDRLEQELGRGLPVATMCLLYLSTRGLHETELLTLLADEENLLPRMRKGEYQQPTVDVTSRLSASRWAALYRAIRHHLRWYTIAGTSRMKLRFTALADVVRTRYLCGEEDEESGEGQGQEEDTEKIAWWRSKLACLQENDDN